MGRFPFELTDEHLEIAWNIRKNGGNWKAVRDAFGISIPVFARYKISVMKYVAYKERTSRVPEHERKRIERVNKMRIEAVKLHGLGLNNKEVALHLGISERTFAYWLEEDANFRHEYDTIQETYNNEIILALRKRATGFVASSTTTTELYDRSGNRIGKTVSRTKKPVLPSIKAHELWLVNKKNWTTKSEKATCNTDENTVEFDIREKAMEDDESEETKEDNDE
jgi:hypothetical protein